MPLFHVHSLEYSYGEDYFVRELGSAGSATIAGVTTPEIRRDRIRQAIIDTGRVNDDLLASKDGKSETFAQRWERFYGLPFNNNVESPVLETCDELP